MKDLKVGMSFEVVEWLGDHSGYESRQIGFQSIREQELSDGCYIYGDTDGCYIHARENEVKPIGKLTITKLK